MRYHTHAETQGLRIVMPTKRNWISPMNQPVLTEEDGVDDVLLDMSGEYLIRDSYTEMLLECGMLRSDYEEYS